MPLGHLGLNVSDLARAKAYYDQLMPMVSFEPFSADDRHVANRPAEGEPGTWIFRYRGEPGYSRHRAGLQHLAFTVRSRAEVEATYDWAVDQGSEVVRVPQELPQYHEGYYAAYWLDPEGFLVEVVCHRDRATHEHVGPTD